MDRRYQDYDQDPVFHERPHLLSSKNYRGFSVKSKERHWNGIKITASTKKGMKVSAIGETEEEALKKLIDQIDLLLE